MKSTHNVFLMNTYQLRAAAQILKSKKPLMAVLLFECADQLEDIYRKWCTVVGDAPAIAGQSALLSGFMSRVEWECLYSKASETIFARPFTRQGGCSELLPSADPGEPSQNGGVS